MLEAGTRDNTTANTKALYNKSYGFWFEIRRSSSTERSSWHWTLCDVIHRHAAARRPRIIISRKNCQHLFRHQWLPCEIALCAEMVSSWLIISTTSFSASENCLRARVCCDSFLFVSLADSEKLFLQAEKVSTVLVRHWRTSWQKVPDGTPLDRKVTYCLESYAML